MAESPRAAAGGTTRDGGAPHGVEAVARWAKVIDHTRCIGCHACTTACKSENEVPLGVTRTYVKSVDVGTFPFARRALQVTRCNQCDDAPCVTACPTTAMFRRPDGIVDFDKSACIGCKACIAACPYDAIFINPEDHSAEKCNFCAHRLEVGLEPACVVVCPTEAILVGDLEDPDSKVSRIVGREPVAVRRPEKGTLPKLFYRGASEATLDPLAARRPGGGLFMWSEQGGGPGRVTSGHPGPDGTARTRSPLSAARRSAGRPSGGTVAPAPRPAPGPSRGLQNSSAAALLSYDIPHSVPWDWRVSLYTWTKSVAAGAYLVPLLLILAGVLGWSGPLWSWAAPVLGGAFLAVTGGLLIWDLEHPERFHFLFTRPQWRSWLVRGAVIIAGYAAVLAAHFAVSLLAGADAGADAVLDPGGEAVAPGGGGAGAGGAAGPGARGWLAVLGGPLAALTAVYTAWLFAQAKARDLWQSPLLPAHLLVQAVMAGAGALAAVAAVAEPGALPALLWTFAGASLVHLLLVWGEVALPHVTAHARLASREMTSGRYRPFFAAGVALVALGLLAPLAAALAPAAAVVCALAGLGGLLAHEHAYVQAGQSVPLA